MKFLLMIILSLQLHAVAVNKLQLCSSYEEAFINSAEVFEDTQNCYDLQYSILSFKQMILANCEIDKDEVVIAWYLQKQLEEKCEVN